MAKLRAVLFDMDGVLLDSLPAHLQICEDLSREYGLDLRIPSQPELKERVRSGVEVSPMEEFFLAVGFGTEFARKADAKYKEVFAQTYKTALFPGVDDMLRKLRDAGFRMGIVTSNVRANVVAALGQSMTYFHPDCICSVDTMHGATKREAITSAIAILQVTPAETIYVGDQRRDWQAARDAGVDFLGVAYGWGLSKEDTDLQIVETVSEIYTYVSARANRQRISEDRPG